MIIDRLKIILLMLVVTSCLTLGQIMLKFAIRGSGGDFLQQVFQIIISKHFVFTALLMIIAGLIWIYLLGRYNLSLIYPLISISYVLMLFASKILLHEKLSINTILGTIIICLGIVVLMWKVENFGVQ
jgi:drug/metabolite transporter (DMT)-like permease